MTVAKKIETEWRDEDCILIKGARVNNLKNIDVRGLLLFGRKLKYVWFRSPWLYNAPNRQSAEPL